MTSQVDSPRYRVAIFRWVGAAAVAGLAILGIFVSDWTVAQKAGAVVGVLVSSAGAAHIDYLVALVFSYRARIRLAEQRLSYLQAQIALALPFRPVLVTGLRQDESRFILLLPPQERITLKTFDRVLIVDTLAEKSPVAEAVVSQFSGQRPDEAPIVQMEQDLTDVLTDWVKADSRGLPDNLVVLRRDEVEHLFTSLGGPQWHSR